jgi:hypothetical protein
MSGEASILLFQTLSRRSAICSFERFLDTLEGYCLSAKPSLNLNEMLTDNERGANVGFEPTTHEF